MKENRRFFCINNNEITYIKSGDKDAESARFD